jgi:hypothetical protein
VDEGLAPLILALWRADIDTVNSCQENRPGVVWVEFALTFDAERFLSLVACYPSDDDLRDTPFWETLYGRITGCGSDQDWEYDAHVMDWGVEKELVDDEVVVTNVGPADFGFSVSIRFPVADLPAVLKRVEESFEEEQEPGGLERSLSRKDGGDARGVAGTHKSRSSTGPDGSGA